MTELAVILVAAAMFALAIAIFYFGGIGPLIAFIIASAIYSERDDDDYASP